MKDEYIRKLKVTLIDGDFENPVHEQVRGPEQLFEIFKSIKDSAQETLLGVYLGDDLRVRVYSVLSIGTSHETIFSPEDVFKHLYITESKSFALVHNHPKGDPSPSPEDAQAMAVLSNKAKHLEVEFLDFIIVGTDSYWSMSEDQDSGDYTLGSL